MRIRRLGQGLLTSAVIAPLAVAQAQAQQPTMEELLQRLEQQEQAIKVLERRLEIKEESDATAAKSAGVVKASEKGFTVQSADGANNVKLRGLLHIDGRALLSEDDTIVDDQFLLRRVRPIVEGTVGGIYDFRFTPDFAQGRTVIQDAYVTGRFAPGFQLTAGKFKAPIGLERLQSASDIRFVERAYPTQLVTNRDIGLQVAGNLLEDRLAYHLAYLNGSNDGRSSEDFSDVEVNDDKEWAGRIFAQPFANSDSFALRGLGFGVAGSYTSQEGNATQTLLPQYRTPAQSTFFKYRSAAVATGDRTRIAPQVYYYAGRFGLLGEGRRCRRMSPCPARSVCARIRSIRPRGRSRPRSSCREKRSRSRATSRIRYSRSRTAPGAAGRSSRDTTSSTSMTRHSMAGGTRSQIRSHRPARPARLASA